jgi:hypothetical protein
MKPELQDRHELGYHNSTTHHKQANMLAKKCLRSFIYCHKEKSHHAARSLDYVACFSRQANEMAKIR